MNYMIFRCKKLKLFYGFPIPNKINQFSTMAIRVISAPKRKRRFMVFDVETTGKLIKNAPIDQQPHIIQLSFIIYDLHERRIIQKFDSYVNIPQNIEISAFITGLTGATREKCDRGMDILDVLDEFYHAYFWCDEIIAHNIEFEIQMIMKPYILQEL